MKIKIDYPGYWAHGKTFDAEPERLHLRQRGGHQGKWEMKDFGAEPVEVPGEFAVPCYVMTHCEWGKFALPVNRCVVLSGE